MARVNRATFYDHYTDKSALFEALIAGDFHKMLQERGVHYDGTCPSAASAVLRGGMQKEALHSGLPAEMIAASCSWAIYGAVKEWFKTPGHSPPEEVVPLILPILQTASHNGSHSDAPGLASIVDVILA